MLYIRHSYKKYANGMSTTFSLDPPLTDHGREKAQEKFTQLLKKYGVPDKITTSPFLRARETAQIAQDVILSETGISVPIKYDRDIGENLEHHQDKDIKQHLRPETLQYLPYPPEKHWQFVKRVKNHRLSDPGNGWYITHGYIIYCLAKQYKQTIKYPHELQGIYIENNNITNI